MRRLIVAVVMACWGRPRLVVALSLLTCLAMGWFAATHLGLDTDESHLISNDLPFRAAEQEMDRAFPSNSDSLVAVIDAPTPELAEQAVNKLAAALAPRTDLFRSVRRPPEETFFRKYGLLFLSADELTELSDRLTAAQPLLAAVARDVSLRGLLSSVELALQGAEHGQMEVKELDPLLERIDAAAAEAAAGKPPRALSWGSLFGAFGDQDQPRRFLMTQPILEYGQLEAGSRASEAIRSAAKTLGMDGQNGIKVRLTGSVALSDANFATVAEGVEVTTPIMVGAVLVLLFLAVRGVALVGAILASLVVGLVATAAFAAATVGTLNPISVAFAVMFVGIAVDFAIQFVIRFRAERADTTDIDQAMRRTAETMAAPLSVAAIATAVGFLSFLPTKYTGVSQLGLIAGGGMIIALVIDFTMLPALMALLKPKAQPGHVGLPLSSCDRWLAGHAKSVILSAGLLALVGIFLLPRLPFDFNPLHLQNPKTEAVATFLDLARDPDSGSYSIDILTAGEREAEALAKRLEALPEIGRVMTLSTFVPDGQDDKVAILQDLAGLLRTTLSPSEPLPTPSDEQLKETMRNVAAKLSALESGTATGKALAVHLAQVAEMDSKHVAAFQDAVVGGLSVELDQLRRMLAVSEPVTAQSLPPELAQGWRAADGRLRVRASPKGNMNDEAALSQFVKAVRAIAPQATGMPVSVEESGKVVVTAFTQAGAAAIAAIAILLGMLLRRPLDALLVVLPLIAGALYTVIGCVLGGLAINFANIIALPLLLGIGVAFNIYLVVNWRAGLKEHLASATTRAILFSALTTGTAFGSLAVSPHLGTASMGFLLFLSLGLSVATTFTLLPALFHILDERKK